MNVTPQVISYVDVLAIEPPLQLEAVLERDDRACRTGGVDAWTNKAVLLGLIEPCPQDVEVGFVAIDEVIMEWVVN